jgi:hypothetical protein
MVSDEKSQPSANSACKYCTDDATRNAPQPRLQMSRILVGAASWTDKSLIASGRIRRNAMLWQIGHATTPRSSRSSKYYPMPALQVAQLSTERTPSSFKLAYHQRNARGS